MSINRRTLLKSGAALGLGSALGTYIYQRGVRYPRLSFEPKPLSNQLETEQGRFFFQDLISLDSDVIAFRAFAPEPQINVKANGRPILLEINNVSRKAKLEVIAATSIAIDEHVTGINRTIKIDSTEAEFKLQWLLPKTETIRFAVIGDTGANAELDACLSRASELNADFLIHLGDFNYIEGEYAKAIRAFNGAPIPCLVSIGNHDFHDNGLIYDRFRREIGPMNNAFLVNGVRLVNLDTGADFFPAQSGNRGKLLNSLSKTPNQQIAFTHRPLKDPRPHDDHEIGGINEIAWLIEALKATGGGYFLNGHVHHSAEFDIEGIRQYTVGEGLGHEDLVLQKQVAKLLTIDLTPDSEIEFNWQALNIPWAAHLSDTHAVKLKRDGRLRQLEWYQNLIS